MARKRRIYIPGKGYRCQDSTGRFVKCSTRSRYSGTSGTSGTMMSTSGTSGTKRRRRRKSSSWFGSLGQTGILSQFKPQLINGGLAAGGAWLAQSLGQRVGKMMNVQPYSTTSNLVTLAVGVVLAGLTAKVLKKPQIGMALGTGAVMITVLNFIGTLTPKTAGVGDLGVLQAEAAPYYQRSAMPPLAPMQALPAGAASVPNLYSDVGVAAIV